MGLIQCRHKLTLKAFYPEGIYSKQFHKQDRIVGVSQGDKARLIQKNFQGLSPCYLKEYNLGDYQKFPEKKVGLWTNQRGQ